MYIYNILPAFKIRWVIYKCIRGIDFASRRFYDFSIQFRNSSDDIVVFFVYAF